MEADEIQFKKLHPDAVIPTRGTEHSAGFDLYALQDTLIVGGAGNVIVPTGIAVQLPEGTYGRLAVRSGHASRENFGISAGVIDIDYTGGIGVVVFSTKVFDVKTAQELVAGFDRTKIFGGSELMPVQLAPTPVTEKLDEHLGTLKKHVPNPKNYCETFCNQVYPVMTPHAYVIKKGERFAQLIPEKISYAKSREVQEFTRTYATHGGFGSTGTK